MKRDKNFLIKVEWYSVHNTVKDRLINGSLVCDFSASNRILKRTKMLNHVLKECPRLKKYQQYKDIISQLRKHVSDNSETDDRHVPCADFGNKINGSFDNSVHKIDFDNNVSCNNANVSYQNDDQSMIQDNREKLRFQCNSKPETTSHEICQAKVHKQRYKFLQTSRDTTSYLPVSVHTIDAENSDWNKNEILPFQSTKNDPKMFKQTKKGMRTMNHSYEKISVEKDKLNKQMPLGSISDLIENNQRKITFYFNKKPCSDYCHDRLLSKTHANSVEKKQRKITFYFKKKLYTECHDNKIEERTLGQKSELNFASKGCNVSNKNLSHEIPCKELNKNNEVAKVNITSIEVNSNQFLEKQKHNIRELNEINEMGETFQQNIQNNDTMTKYKEENKRVSTDLCDYNLHSLYREQSLSTLFSEISTAESTRVCESNSSIIKSICKDVQELMLQNYMPGLGNSGIKDNSENHHSNDYRRNIEKTPLTVNMCKNKTIQNTSHRLNTGNLDSVFTYGCCNAPMQICGKHSGVINGKMLRENGNHQIIQRDQSLHESINMIPNMKIEENHLAKIQDNIEVPIQQHKTNNKASPLHITPFNEGPIMGHNSNNVQLKKILPKIINKDIILTNSKIVPFDQQNNNEIRPVLHKCNTLHTKFMNQKGVINKNSKKGDNVIMTSTAQEIKKLNRYNLSLGCDMRFSNDEIYLSKKNDKKIVGSNIDASTTTDDYRAITEIQPGEYLEKGKLSKPQESARAISSGEKQVTDKKEYSFNKLNKNDVSDAMFMIRHHSNNNDNKTDGTFDHGRKLKKRKKKEEVLQFVLGCQDENEIQGSEQGVIKKQKENSLYLNTEVKKKSLEKKNKSMRHCVNNDDVNKTDEICNNERRLKKRKRKEETFQNVLGCEEETYQDSGHAVAMKQTGNYLCENIEGEKKSEKESKYFGHSSSNDDIQNIDETFCNERKLKKLKLIGEVFQNILGCEEEKELQDLRHTVVQKQTENLLYLKTDKKKKPHEMEKKNFGHCWNNNDNSMTDETVSNERNLKKRKREKEVFQKVLEFEAEKKFKNSENEVIEKEKPNLLHLQTELNKKHPKKGNKNLRHCINTNDTEKAGGICNDERKGKRKERKSKEVFQYSLESKPEHKLENSGNGVMEEEKEKHLHLSTEVKQKPLEKENKHSRYYSNNNDFQKTDETCDNERKLKKRKKKEVFQNVLGCKPGKELKNSVNATMEEQNEKSLLQNTDGKRRTFEKESKDNSQCVNNNDTQQNEVVFNNARELKKQDRKEVLQNLFACKQEKKSKEFENAVLDNENENCLLLKTEVKKKCREGKENRDARHWSDNYIQKIDETIINVRKLNKRKLRNEEVFQNVLGCEERKELQGSGNAFMEKQIENSLYLNTERKKKSLEKGNKYFGQHSINNTFIINENKSLIFTPQSSHARNSKSLNSTKETNVTFGNNEESLSISDRTEIAETLRPRNIQELIVSESLIHTNAEPSLTLNDISDDEDVWLFEIPKTIHHQKFKGRKIIIKENNLVKIGEEKYNALCIDVRKASCVVNSGTHKNQYKTVNIKPVGSILIRKKPIK
ncbi:uncharacterized protein LOC105697785 [Orussus abietinus]|uniref:uncharacterized protein LOC105697785 n=1 Tax=Orussus abietinus TaxID=222816 RepID=UPI00062551BA|nr:uncharacterized protein LOC105697785 [Orussus abietinus]